MTLTAWQWLMSFIWIPGQNEPNKSPWRKRLLALLLWEIGHLSSPSRSCLGRLILICGRWRGSAVKLPHTGKYSSNICWKLMWIPASRIRCGCNIYIHTDYRGPVEEKGRPGHSSRGERLWAPQPLPPEENAPPTLALTGFYCFSRPLTTKKVLFYYAKVYFGWLSFADKEEGGWIHQRRIFAM